MKMTEIFSSMPMPTHRMSSGIKAETGRYRTKLVTGSIAASTTLKLPMRMPIGTARTEAMMNPDMISPTLTAVFTRSEPSLIPAIAARTTASGVGRKSSRTNPP
jgi:hypothetical protein